MMGTPTVPLRVYWLLLCWLLLIIGQIAIFETDALAPCLPQEPDSLRVYAGQDAEHTCLLIFFRAVGF